MMCFTIIFILINFTNSLYITKLIINSFHRDSIKLMNRKYDIYMNDNFYNNENDGTNKTNNGYVDNEKINKIIKSNEIISNVTDIEKYDVLDESFKKIKEIMRDTIDKEEIINDFLNYSDNKDRDIYFDYVIEIEYDNLENNNTNDLINLTDINVENVILDKNISLYVDLVDNYNGDDLQDGEDYEFSKQDLGFMDNDTEYPFPSFYSFLRRRELDKKIKYFEKSKKIVKKEKYDDIISTSKDLKLLNSLSTVEWTRNWIYDMVNYQNTFPQFMYRDMFAMRDFAINNTSQNYFYIGYFPTDIRLIQGPYYIGAFELKPQNREFHTMLIIQNPNYMIESEFDERKMIKYKRELVNLTKDSMVFFKFAQLKNASNKRYFYSWLYEDNEDF